MSSTNFNNCFACGKKNPIGLKLDFVFENNSAKCNFKLSNSYEGYPRIIHGGIISTILDESMAKIILFHDITAVTVELSVKYRKALEPEKDYHVTAIILKEKSRSLETEAEITDLENNIIASATAKFIKRKL